VPIPNPDGRPAGGIGLLTERGRLVSSEWELLGAFAAQAAQPLERALAFEHEHEVAFRLQQSLLPSELPTAPGLSLAGEYAAGGTGVDVGGDWYDAVLRPDGSIMLCVGDVSGRGAGAATVMGRQRSTFRAYAFDYPSPAEILRRMIRHVDDDEMTTVVCISIDPLEGVLVYSSAGHPPPLLLDRDSGEVVRLDHASAPPLGVAEPIDVIERSLPLPARAALAMYTDGLVERRGESIEEGIGVLGRTMAARPNISARTLLSAISEAIGRPTDDVALLLASIEPAASFEIELEGRPDVLPGLRRRLRAWLGRQGFEAASADVVLAVSEALNNAIEHAYRDVEGPVRLRVAAEGSLLSIEISDRGRWSESEPNDERGRGILLMNRLMDRVEIESNGTGTTVTLERRGRAPTTTASPVAPST
jgi:anti-sigma regulatory factor (Ser/Thr protein kinase)